MKPLDRMSAREIEALGEKRHARVSANNRALIDAGFGERRGSEIRDMDHPLADEYRRVNDAWQEVLAELHARERWHGSHRPIRRRTSGLW